MYFTKLKYKNLLSTGNQWTTIELNKHKTCLVVGENGSGKSTILDALSFALFNKPFRTDFNKPQLVNAINNKNCVAEVEFSIGSRHYKVTRGIKPHIFEIYEDGRLLNQDANVRDQQDDFEKNILKINHRSFCQVVILGSASYVPFMKLPALARREVVEDILDLKIFSIMNSLLNSKKQQNDTALTQNTTEKKLLTQKIDLIKQHNEHLTATNNKLIEDKKERIQETEQEIAKAKEEIASTQKILKENKEKIKDYQKQLQLQKEYSQLKYKLETKIATLDKGINFFHNNETCPTCSQKIDEDFKCDILSRKNLHMQQTTDAVLKLNQKLETVNKRLDKIKTISEVATADEFHIRTLENRIEQWEHYINELQSEIKLVQSHNKEIDKDELIRLSSKLDGIVAEYNNLIKRKALLDFAGILLKDSGIKAKIIKQYVPIINKLVNKYLSSLDFFVNFTLNERFEEKILSRFRDEFTYGSFSEGEKFRINLAILFTWRAVAKLRNSVNTNILFLDEILDSSLDLPGTEEFLKIINETDVPNVFIISHKVDQLYDKFENVLKFEKKRNFSKLYPI